MFNISRYALTALRYADFPLRLALSRLTVVIMVNLFHKNPTIRISGNKLPLISQLLPLISHNCEIKKNITHNEF